MNVNRLHLVIHMKSSLPNFEVIMKLVILPPNTFNFFNTIDFFFLIKVSPIKILLRNLYWTCRHQLIIMVHVNN